MNRLKSISNSLLGFVILIIIWQLIITIGHYDAALFPPPLEVGKAIIKMIQDGSIFEHLKVSLMRFFIGYFLSVIVAILFGLLLGRLTKLWAIMDPIVQILRPVSPIAWSPFIVLWFGIGDIPAIVIIFIAAFFPVLLSTVQAVRKMDQTYVRVAQNFEMKQSSFMWKVLLPAAFPFIANGLHIALGSAWIFLVAGEMVGAQSGLGFLIVDARNSLSLDVVLAGIIYIGITGLILDKGIKWFEAWVAQQWGGQTTRN